jgi:hypothetical protein
MAIDAMPLGVQWMGVDGQDGALAASAHWCMQALA